MEWIFIGIAALVVLTLAVLPIWKAKHQPGSVHGDFRFDSHKTGELSKLGIKENPHSQITTAGASSFVVRYYRFVGAPKPVPS